MANAFFRTNFIDVPGPDGVTMDGKGPDMRGKQLSYVMISPPFRLGNRDVVIVRAHGHPNELDDFKHEQHVNEIPEPAVEAQIRAHTGSNRIDGKVKDKWKVRE